MKVHLSCRVPASLHDNSVHSCESLLGASRPVPWATAVEMRSLAENPVSVSTLPGPLGGLDLTTSLEKADPGSRATVLQAQPPALVGQRGEAARGRVGRLSLLSRDPPTPCCS